MIAKNQQKGGTILKGAMGVATVAGAVAAGVALSNPDTRKRVIKGVRNTVDIAQKTAKALRIEGRRELQDATGKTAGLRKTIRRRIAKTRKTRAN